MSLPGIASIPRINPVIIGQIRQLETVRPGLFLHLLGMFERNTTQLLDELEARIGAGDLEKLRVGFHSLKGTSASLGAERLSVIAGLAEKAASGETAVGSLRELAFHLHREFSEVRSELRAAAVNGPAHFS